MKIFSMIAYLFFALAHGGESAYALLVNAENPLGPAYVPTDLVCVRHARAGREELCLMQKTAAEALDAMLDAAESAGCEGVSVTNGYRSYDYQKFLYYEYYPRKEMNSDRTLSYGEALQKVGSYCRAPGESEHQTGLCCDLHDKAIGRQEDFADSPASRWLEENAHCYGFILRYPKGKERVTGTVYEPWHYRYVGAGTAAFIYERSLTLEEFHSFFKDIDITDKTD